MLKQLREKTKMILWVVVVAFVVSIFAVWGMNLRTPTTRLSAENAIGSVDGVPISRTDYSNSFSEVYEQLRQQRGEDLQLSPMEQRMLAEQAWAAARRAILVPQHPHPCRANRPIVPLGHFRRAVDIYLLPRPARAPPRASRGLEK